MSRRIGWIAVGGAVLVLLVSMALLPMIPVKERRLKIENYPRIAKGMTLKEVEDLLGGPPGNYGLHPIGKELMTLEGYPEIPGAVEKHWKNETNLLEIYFDSGDRVVGIHHRAGYRQYPPESWISRFWRFLGR